MAEIFAIVGGGITLAAQLVTVGQAIHKATQRVQHAREDIERLADEVITFSGIYEDFCNIRDGQLGTSRTISQAVRCLERWARDIIAVLARILEGVNTLRLDGRDKRSIKSVLVAHLEWFFKRNAVERLRASLSVARETINGFLLVVTIRRLDAELELLENALHDRGERFLLERRLNVKLEEQIEKLKKARSGRKIMYEATTRMTQTAQERFSKTLPKTSDPQSLSHADQLSRFTESVEHCKTHVQARPRAHGANASSSSQSVRSEPHSSSDTPTALDLILSRFT